MKITVSFQPQLCFCSCSCLCCLCPLSMCLCLLSSMFVPTLHSITLFLPLSLFFAAIRIFVYSVYARVCVCVQSLCLCTPYFCPAVSFCPLCAFLPLCVCLSALFSLCPRCLCQIRSLCVHSACIVRAHSRCLCLLSSVFAPTLLLPALCTLSVFVHSVSHRDLWTFYCRHVWHVDAYSNSRILQNIQLNHISAM